jgi:hypothetical protein
VSNNPAKAEEYLTLAEEAEEALMSQSRKLETQDQLLLLGPGECNDAPQEAVRVSFACIGGHTD